jgi:salicylate hydroxylase
LGCRVEGFRQAGDKVTVRLVSGEQITGDALIGADGIHSVIRPQVVGDGETTFSGKLCWRALIPAERIAHLDFKDRFYGWAGKDRMVWAYWVRPKTLFNFGGVVPATEVHRESWDETADLDELKASLMGSNPRLAGLIDAIDRAFVTGLFDRDPLPRWTSGRVTLLGDSAHAMLPYLAQGACQSLEDGLVLASCLARYGDGSVPAALADYELRRRPRTTKVQSTARATHIFWTEGNQIQARARNGRMRGLAQIDPLATTIWRWLYAYDARAAGNDEAVAPDKRGVRRQYPGDTEAQRRAWDMWHDLFTAEEEAGGIVGLRRGYDRFFGQFKTDPTTKVTRVTIDDATGLWIDPAGLPKQIVVLHLHGGGFAFGSADCSVEYGERLARAVGGRCLALNYRLAPEHPYPAAVVDAVAAYRWLLAQGYRASEILISGESAGGGLAVSTTMSLRDSGIALPAGVIVLSPFVDCTLSSKSIDQRDGQDPILDRDILTYMATSYFQSHPASDPLVSPVFGDLKGLPPLLIQAAKEEGLVDDAKRLAQRAKADGVAVDLHLYDERMHIFSLFPFLESAGKALSEISEFARNHMPQMMRA